MAGDETRDGRPDEPPHEAQRLSAARLFLIVLVFLALSAYAIWNSDRFQSLFQGVSEQRLSELLQRPVAFRRLDFQVFPPSIHLADVRVGNDPRIPDQAMLEAEELTIGGGVSVTGGTLRFGRVRAIKPRIQLVQFPDGTWNLPPGLSRSSGKGGGGLSLQIGELVVQSGVFEFEGRKTGLDGRFEGFAAELEALPANRYRGTFICKRTTLRFPAAEPLVFGVDLAFRLGPHSGFQLESARVNGDFGEIRASGAAEDLKNPGLLLRLAADLHVAEVERVFHSNLGFGGDAAVQAELSLPPGGDFRIGGKLSVPKLDAKGFAIENFAASVIARPDALIGRIERGRYAGGEISGVYRIEGLSGGSGRASPMTLSLDGKEISVERFFGDIHLPGTGLSGSAALSATLRWAEGGIEHANGAARLAIDAGPSSSIVRGRFGIPVAGGGSLPVVDGRILFEGASFRLATSTLELTGGLRIGEWQPDFDFKLRARDLVEIDRIFQNFEAASGGAPSPLGFGGSGDIDGHIARSWSDPEVTARFTAENARYGGVLFGSVRGAADMHDGAFVFHPLRVYDGSTTLSLEGTTRYRKDPNRPTFDFVLTAKEWPVQRLLEYLDLDYPVEGRMTGSFPIQGSPPNAVTGGGVAALEDAVLWGQKVPRMTGRMLLSPGTFTIDDLRADIGSGMVGGRISIAYRDKAFEARAAGDGIRLESIAMLERFAKDVSGSVSFDLAASGAFSRPDLTATARLSQATFYGHPVPEALSPRLAARVTHGVVDASVTAPDKWTVTAKGDAGATPVELDIGVEARDVASLLLFTPAALPEGDGGALALHGRLRLPSGEGDWPSGRFTVTEARLDARDRPGLVRTDGDVTVTIGSGRIAVDGLHAVGEGIDLRLSGAADLSGEKPAIEGRASGSTDAALLSLAAPDLGLTGRLVLDLGVKGPAEAPSWSGGVRIENGRYRAAGYSFDDIEGGVRLVGQSAEIEGLRAKVAEGEAFLSGNLRFDGTRLKDFRLVAQARRIGIRAVPALRLTIDADLVATGNESGNQLHGEITLLRGTYSKDVEVTLSDILERSRPGGAIPVRDAWKERTTLDVRIVSAAALEVRNNLARLSGTVDLRARGTLADPVLLGQVILDEGGRVVFSDIRYEIEAGTLTFSNASRIAPFVDIRARAEVKGYNLIVMLAGTWPRISANFTSDPPLANDAILGLLLSGSPPDTRFPTDTANQLVSAAGGAVAGAATAPLREQTRRLFKLDRFQIEPVFTGSQITTVRSTIGKQITQDLAVTSSIALDSSKEPIVRVEWQATNDILVRADPGRQRHPLGERAETAAAVKRARLPGLVGGSPRRGGRRVRGRGRSPGALRAAGRVDRVHVRRPRRREGDRRSGRVARRPPADRRRDRCDRPEPVRHPRLLERPDRGESGARRRRRRPHSSLARLSRLEHPLRGARAPLPSGSPEGGPAPGARPLQLGRSGRGSDRDRAPSRRRRVGARPRGPGGRVRRGDVHRARRVPDRGGGKGARGRPVLRRRHRSLRRGGSGREAEAEGGQALPGGEGAVSRGAPAQAPAQGRAVPRQRRADRLRARFENGAAIRPVYRIEIGPEYRIEATGIKEKTVRSQILSLLEGQSFDEDLLAQWVDSTRDELQRKGRYRAVVEAKTEGKDPVILRVSVNEGGEVSRSSASGSPATRPSRTRRCAI